MLTRTHSTDTTQSQAQYSNCGTYRYSLTRTWDADGKRLLYIMLNPSKATEVQNDPTIERCERRAKTLGFGAFCAANIFALRETDPHKMRRHPHPTGPDADEVLNKVLADWIRPGDMILAAWGTHGTHLDRGPQVASLLQASAKPLHTLGLTKHGHPKHPLYISYSQSPELWSCP